MSGSVTPAERAALERARALARRAAGHVSPNPLVGAVVLRDGEAVGEGWHAGPGQAHAEVMALSAVDDPRGTTVVCTLEPCSHHGRTPPCTVALTRSGVRRVVVGALDPLERARAQGVRVLREQGVEVVVAEDEDAAACRELNSAFITWAVTGRPEVTLKMATSMDGRIATAAGQSRWITGAESRRRVHRLRAESDAVAVGGGTALADDPALTARDLEGPVRQPLRVVFDSMARLPRSSALARTADAVPVVVFCSVDAPADSVSGLREAGVEVVALDGDPAARLAAALDELGGRELQSVLVEGGAGLAAGMLAARLVDRVMWMQAPILIGGREAPGAVGDPGVASLEDAPRLSGVRVERVGEDIAISGRLRPIPGAEG